MVNVDFFVDFGESNFYSPSSIADFWLRCYLSILPWMVLRVKDGIIKVGYMEAWVNVHAWLCGPMGVTWACFFTGVLGYERFSCQAELANC